MKKSLFLCAFCLQFIGLFSQSLPFQRAATLGKGMALSSLERYWLGDPARNFADYFDVNRLQSRKNELHVMKQMGIKTLRLPVWFSGWYSSSASNPTLQTPQYYAAVDSFVQWTNDLDMNIIIDFHQGNLTNANKGTETQRIANIWQQIAAHFASSNPNRVFFEIYNEPDGISSPDWKIVANQIVTAIRTKAPAHTLIVGGVIFNDVTALDQMGALFDNNIIYTFHFYEPFIFTHQGASWVENGVPVATKGIPFPFNAATMPPMNNLVRNTWGESSYTDYSFEGTADFINKQLLVAYQFQTKYQRPVYCGELGSDAVFADLASRCRLLKTVRQTLENWKIPYAWWDWDGGFSMFRNNTPALSNLPDCFLDAWGITTNPATGSGSGSGTGTPTNGDIAVELTANVVAYQPYSNITYKITLKNNGTTAFSNVKIELPFPTNTVNGGAATPSVGKWIEFCGNTKCNTWTIPTLTANGTATLTIPVFNLNTTQTVVATAKLLSSSPTDVQTANNQSVVTLNKITANALLTNYTKPTQLLPVVIQSIDPTITEGDMMLQIESLIEKETAISIYNSIGTRLKTLQLKVEKGNSRQPIDVWDLPQGIYFIAIDGVKMGRVPLKFVKM